VREANRNQDVGIFGDGERNFNAASGTVGKILLVLTIPS
jgi:hypothetical protein